MAQNGAQGLENPEVLKVVAQLAVQKGLAMSQDAASFAARIAQDPQVQAQAISVAKAAGRTALCGATMAANELWACIERGPKGIRLLSCIGGCGSLLLALPILFNPFTLVFAPSRYITGAYQALFGLTTVVFEAPQEWVDKYPQVEGYQAFLQKWCPFLSVVGGRGLFYIFQASLWFNFAGFTNLMTMCAATYLLMMGGFHVAMHFGVMPKDALNMTRKYVKQAAQGTEGMGDYSALRRNV